MNAIELTQGLIRCPSVTPDDHGALGFVQDFLTPLGFKCERFIFSEDGTPSIDNLYARYGSEGPLMVFAGHTDVVPVGDAAAWSQPPFEGKIVDGKIYGRGAVDMKGAIGAFMAAARDFIASGKFKGSIALLLTGDEEGPAINGTKKVLDVLNARGEKIDFCIIGEPTSDQVFGDTIKIGRRGSMNTALTIHGMQGHAAYPEKADNPLPKLVHFLSKIMGHLDEGTPEFQPSNLEVTGIDTGNPTTNVIPAKVSAYFNIRYNTLHSSVSLQKMIQDELQKQGLKYDAQFKLSGESFLTKATPWVDVLAKEVKAVADVQPILGTGGGISDAKFIHSFSPLAELGLCNGLAHKVDECVPIQDLEMLTAIYHNFLKKFFA